MGEEVHKDVEMNGIGEEDEGKRKLFRTRFTNVKVLSDDKQKRAKNGIVRRRSSKNEPECG